MKKPSLTISKLFVLGGISLSMLACQSASQSSSSMPAPPMPPSSSTSSSSSSSSQASSSSSSSRASSSPSVSQSSGAGASSSPSSSSSGQTGTASQASRSGNQTTTNASNFPAGSQDLPSGQSQSGQQATVGGSFPSNSNNTIGQEAGSQTRSSGKQDASNTGRDTSTGDLSQGSGGDAGSGGDILSDPSGDYSLDSLPDGVLGGNNNSQTTGAMTAAERAAVLDERLRRGYETFDGFILSERERAQNESNAAGSAQPGGEGAQNLPQTLEEASGQPPGAVVTAQSTSTPPGEVENQTYPVPEDIPNRRDDDVAARQLRELAMTEPDPVRRERLWNEYRNYIGIGEEQ